MTGQSSVRDSSGPLEARKAAEQALIAYLNGRSRTVQHRHRPSEHRLTSTDGPWTRHPWAVACARSISNRPT